jgi:hypothetical protein
MALMFLATGMQQHDGSPAARRPTVILELYTSQGCSSCPPADALLSRLGREKSSAGIVIPLAFHVDYWNRIGWTDPFSSSLWSERQGRYAAVRKTEQVYTPQMVLNGTAQVVGNDERSVRAEIARQLRAPRSGILTISRITPAPHGLSVDVTAELKGAPARSADVYIALFENDVSTAVRTGENAGRRLANDYIVRFLKKGFSISSGGAAKTRTVEVPLEPSWRRDRLGVVAFSQDPRTLAIHGASEPQPVNAVRR